ncbi:MAG: hypothetical protein WCF94_00075 [bacterium]
MKGTKSLIILAGLLAVFCLGTKPAMAVCTDNTDGMSRDQLQQVLNDCEKEIADQKKTLTSTQKQSTILESAISSLNSKIKKADLDIKARNIQIKQLGTNINDKVVYIGKLSDKIVSLRSTIGELMRDSQDVENVSLPEMIFSGENFSTFWGKIDQQIAVNSKIRDLSLEIQGVKVDSEQQKKDLENKQSAQEKLKFEQEAEKRKTENYKLEQQTLLKFTKGQEDAYKKMIAEREKIKLAINNRIFKTVGGQEMKFGEAVKLIQPYESQLGVSTAFVLAILTQESGINGEIGKNIGKCFYNQSASNTNGTVMSNSQKASFLAIMSELGMNPDTTPVSCPIYQDGQYGGAMGPAQFMPNTWWNVGTLSGFKQRVANLLGKSSASPFVNLDAFVATGLYLKDAVGVCRTSFTKTWDLWSCGAAKYYGGLALKNSRLSTYMYSTYGYGHQVADRATQFQKDIDLLDD